MPISIPLRRAVVGLATLALFSTPCLLVSQPAASVSAVDSLSLSLADALQRLSSRHPELAIARGSRAMAEAVRAGARSTVRNRYLPLASASFATQRLAQNQFTAIARRAGLAPVPIEEADPFTKVFASPNTRTATATATIRPFDGGVAQARMLAATRALEATALDEAQTRAMLELAVVERYSDLQLHRRLLQVADSAIVQAERTLLIARQSLENGRGAAFEVWRAEAAVAAQRPAQVDAHRQARLAELSLRQLVDLPPETPLRLVSTAEPWSESSPRDAPSLALTRTDGARLALRSADAREREASAQRQAARRALLPTVDVTLQHQQFAYPLRASSWAGPYFQNTTVVATVALPLDLTGGSASRIEWATAALRVAQAQRRAAEQAHQREALDVALLLESAATAWQAAVAGESSAEQAYRAAMTRYEAGRSSLLELQDAQLAWQQAVANRARATRDRTVAEARAARLDRLPLISLQP